MKFKDVLAKIAPTLGAAFGGPIGGALGLVAKTLLGKDTATEEELSTALAGASPEQLLALKQADQAFAVQMRELDIDIIKLQVADVGSAREMAKSTSIAPQLSLTILYNLGYFTLIILKGFYKDRFDLDANLMGILTMIVPVTVTFWFGSTFGSAIKTKLLAESKPANGS